MLSKLSNKRLVLILIALAAAAGLWVFLTDQKPKSTMLTYLSEFDTSAVDRVEFSSVKENTYQLAIKNGKWVVINQNKEFLVDQEQVERIINQLSALKPSKLISRKTEKWPLYELDDSVATRVTLFSGSDVLADLFIGKFTFNQAKRSMGTYVRQAADDAVYETEGALAFDLKKKPDDWRNKDLLKFDLNEVKTISGVGSANYQITHSENGWNSSIMLMDSVAIESFARGLSSLRGTQFNNEMNPNEFDQPVFQLKVENSDGESQTLSQYNRNGKQLLISSLNSSSVFEADSMILNKLIPVLPVQTNVGEMENN